MIEYVIIVDCLQLRFINSGLSSDSYMLIHSMFSMYMGYWEMGEVGDF